MISNHPYILCSAIWFDDGQSYIHQPKNIKSGFVIYGRRHHNCFQIVSIMNDGKKIKTIKRPIQGFLTSDDRFVDRHEAVDIALISKQIVEVKKELFSEDLY